MQLGLQTENRVRLITKRAGFSAIAAGISPALQWEWWWKGVLDNVKQPPEINELWEGMFG